MKKSLPLMAAAVSAAASPGLTFADNTDVNRPNVIVVLTDDQGYGDLGFTGNPVIETPNIDAFAGWALRMSNYHVGTTSTPSRAGLMTGRNCLRNGTWHTIVGANLLNENEKTFADYFSEAGYVTGLFGKWGLGDTYTMAPDSRGFQEVVTMRGGGLGQTPGYWDNDYRDPVLFHNRRPEKYKGYCTDIFFQESLRFIRENKDRPFLCYLSLNAAHAPFNVPEKYYNKYKDVGQLTEDQKRFFGMITNIDENFGRLLQSVSDWGLEDNTILIFTTDNGTCRGHTFYNAGMKGRKGSEYDGGHRVPFFLRWPAGGFSKGVDYDGLAAHVDFLPTIMAMAGIGRMSDRKLDGTNLLPYLRSGKEVERMLVTDVQRIPWPKKYRKSCVMKSNWRLVNGKELYDISTDPGQRHNLISEHRELADRMIQFYEQWWTDAEQEFAYSDITVVPDVTTAITCQDIHTEGIPAWNQRFVREGRLSSPGYFTLNFKETGKYRVTLRRWPGEAHLSMSASVPGRIYNVPYWDDIADGVSLKFSSAYVEIGGTRYEAKVDNNSMGVEFIVPVQAGKTQLKPVLVLMNGKETCAFYTEIEKIDGLSSQ